MLVYIEDIYEDLVDFENHHQEDIDGATLALLQQNDVVQIFPRIKDRVKFVDLRTKLIVNLSEHSACTDGITTDLFESTTLSSLPSLGVLQQNNLPNSSILNKDIEANNSLDQTTVPDLSSNISLPDDDDGIDDKPQLPADYEGPQLTVRMQNYVDDDNFSKFNPHTAMRGQLLSLLFDDVTKSHQLLYPTNDEYRTMARCIVKKLAIPPVLVQKALKDWHESIKQKFKRERKPLQMINKVVKNKQNKYGNGKTNGRPKKKSIILQAERRITDIPMINLADGQNQNLLSVADQMKAELLKDNPDNDLLHNLWRQSFNIRRLCIRELPIDEVLERFPCYRLPEMIFSEVKESTGVDIETNTNELLPKFFDHLPDNNCFLSDVLPIRIIRILCKIFRDSVGNILTYQDILVPYPTIKILDDKFEIYLDFHLITETTSISTALALLLSLYLVFEIRFSHHNRCCRLLYSLLLEDSHYLNKALKNLLNSWNYKINNRQSIKRQAAVTNLIRNTTQPSLINQNISSSSNSSNQIADTPLQQSARDQRSSNRMESTTSKNIHQLSLDQLNGEDNDPLSSSDDEDHFNRYSMVSPPDFTSQPNSPMVVENETTESLNIEEFRSDSKLQETNEPYTSEDEPDTLKEAEQPSSSFKRKRTHYPSSSSTIPLQKQSARLAAERFRVN